VDSLVDIRVDNLVDNCILVACLDNQADKNLLAGTLADNCNLVVESDNLVDKILLADSLVDSCNLGGVLGIRGEIEPRRGLGVCK